MSARADIIDAFKGAVANGVMSKYYAARLVVDIWDALEWDIEGVDYDYQDFPDQELEIVSRWLNE